MVWVAKLVLTFEILPLDQEGNVDDFLRNLLQSLDAQNRSLLALIQVAQELFIKKRKIGIYKACHLSAIQSCTQRRLSSNLNNLLAE